MSAHDVFVEEAKELLARIEKALLGFADSQSKTEVLNEVFRAAHTLKGAAGVFGFESIVQFAHGAETLLDKAREGEVQLGETEIKTLLAAHDELVRLIEGVEAGNTSMAGNEALVKQLTALCEGAEEEEEEEEEEAPPPPPKAKAKVKAKSAAVRKRVNVRFGAPVMREGFDPFDFLHTLEKCGSNAKRTCDWSATPQDQSFNPEDCYLKATVELDTKATDDLLKSVFDFILDSSTVTVESADMSTTSAPAPSASAPAPQPSATAPAPAPAPSASAGHPPAQAQSQTAQEAVAEKMVKVPAGRLDALIDLVGELVIAAAASEAAAQRHDVLATKDAQGTVSQLVASIRDTALALRMVPIGDTFSRFHRVVRDVSKQLGKDINLEVRGAETELDKSIVERLVDPLTHIVRNSLDHGVETVEARVAAGKAAKATLVLSAFHEGGSIVVDVKDDGRGLNRTKILQKAIEKGLVAADAQLSNEAIDELIFVPGFSSADQVSSLSGRGVGMDVVRRSVEGLRGTVQVMSTEGAGTTVRLRVPLTLAIIDGFQVGIGGRTWVVPLKVVHECIDLPLALESEANHRLDLRGEIVPFIRLRDFFSVPGDKPARECVVVVEDGDKRIGLVVDQLLGASQAVIKPLGPLFKHIDGIGGATLLGTGEVGFVVDVAQLVRKAAAVSARRSPATA